ncbi:hypothetical protein LJK88_16320 [Paenibacillus sp. P26]|nr:hypothetical protein LJK88_16320 [Paenibacillus sp. P26]
METDRRSLTDVYFLNVKYLLILLVVSANAIEPIIPRSGFANALYESIYLFHIPMFVMVMGYLAKGSRWDRKGLAFFRTIAWQYLLFQTVYSLVDMFYFHAKGVVYSFFMPYSLLWFLFSHWIWRAMLLGFKNIPHPVFVSVLLGIAVGYLPWTGAGSAFQERSSSSPSSWPVIIFRWKRSGRNGCGDGGLPLRWRDWPCLPSWRRASG